MWNQCGISCIKAEQVLRGNLPSLCRPTNLYRLTFDTTGSSAAVKCPCLGCERLIMNYLIKRLTRRKKSQNPAGSVFTQYFNICVYNKDEMNCSQQPFPDGAVVCSLPCSLVKRRERINNIIMIAYPTQRSPLLLLLCAKPPATLTLPRMKM